MMGVMLSTLVGVSALNAYLSGRRAKQQIEHQLHEVTSTLSESSFPITGAVLKQISRLTGAEFVADNGQERVFGSIETPKALPQEFQPQQAESFRLGKPITIGDQKYFYTVVLLQRNNMRDRTVSLHILYPVQSYHEIWQQAVLPPLTIGAVALILVIALAGVISARIVRPMLRLQSQVGKIAEGDFRRLELSDRDDEVRDLSRSINHMAELLSRYEDEVRQSERLRTLSQLGSGIAHQIRNSATGCRLAIELHERECPPVSDCDCLEVANRQVTLMEKQLKRFLSLGNPNSRPMEVVDLGSLVENTLHLLQPFARHVGIELEWNRPEALTTIMGDSDAIEQLLINLLLNAIEAASQGEKLSLSHTEKGRVTIQIKRLETRHVHLEITDSGCGPSESVQKKLFDPFITDKPDGTGLGLSVAQEIAEQHGGEIRWSRHEKTTSFTVELPLASVETQRVEVTCS